MTVLVPMAVSIDTIGSTRCFRGICGVTCSQEMFFSVMKFGLTVTHALLEFLVKSSVGDSFKAMAIQYNKWLL